MDAEALAARIAGADTELLALWDAIWEVGRPHGLAAGGYRAIDSCRVEKGNRVRGADITREDTPWAAHTASANWRRD